MRILVAGGSGFIGGHVARALLAAGHDVTCIGRGGRTGPGGSRFVAADRDDPAAMAAALAGLRFDATLDFSGYDRAQVESLLGAPRFEPGRYVFASTGQVCLVGTAPRNVPYRESDAEFPLIPEPAPGTVDHGQWSYGTGKRRAEAAVAETRERRGLAAVVLRLPVIWGAGDASLRPWAYLERMLDGGPILLPGGGSQGVRFLWVEDVARAVLRVLERWPLPAPVYHVAQPDIVPLSEVLERMATAAGLRPEFVPVGEEALAAGGVNPGPQGLPFFGPWVSVLDPGLARRDWGFEATPLDGYLPAVVRDLLDHRPRSSHPGYAQRERELELARRLKSGAA